MSRVVDRIYSNRGMRMSMDMVNNIINSRMVNMNNRMRIRVFSRMSIQNRLRMYKMSNNRRQQSNNNMTNNNNNKISNNRRDNKRDNKLNNNQNNNNS